MKWHAIFAVDVNGKIRYEQFAREPSFDWPAIDGKPCDEDFWENGTPEHWVFVEHEE